MVTEPMENRSAQVSGRCVILLIAVEQNQNWWENTTKAKKVKIHKTQRRKN